MAGFTGRVSGIPGRATQIETEAGQTGLIPHATVFTSPIIKDLNGLRVSRPDGQKARG